MNKRFLQTEAEELSKRFPDSKLKAIAKWGCCAFTALWIMGIEPTTESITLLADEMGKGLDEECTVKWYDFFRNVSGRAVKVEFRDIKTLLELNKVKGRIAVRFDCGKNSHWVGVEGGEVAYNSLKYSNCVTNGKPTKARIITFA